MLFRSNDYISLEAESENPRRKEIRVFQDNLLTNNTDRLVEKEIQESFKKETQKLTEDEINKKNQEDSNKRTEIKQNKEEDERELEELLETLFYGAI